MYCTGIPDRIVWDFAFRVSYAKAELKEFLYYLIINVSFSHNACCIYSMSTSFSTCSEESATVLLTVINILGLHTLLSLVSVEMMMLCQ